MSIATDLMDFDFLDDLKMINDRIWMIENPEKRKVYNDRFREVKSKSEHKKYKKKYNDNRYTKNEARGNAGQDSKDGR